MDPTAQGRVEGTHRGPDGAGLGSRKQYDELVPTEAGHGPLVAGQLTKPLGHLDDELVARRMAIGVVDELELVEIDDRDAEG